MSILALNSIQVTRSIDHPVTLRHQTFVIRSTPLLCSSTRRISTLCVAMSGDCTVMGGFVFPFCQAKMQRAGCQSRRSIHYMVTRSVDCPVIFAIKRSVCVIDALTLRSAPSITLELDGGMQHLSKANVALAWTVRE